MSQGDEYSLRSLDSACGLGWLAGDRGTQQLLQGLPHPGKETALCVSCCSRNQEGTGHTARAQLCLQEAELVRQPETQTGPSEAEQTSGDTSPSQ